MLVTVLTAFLHQRPPLILCGFKVVGKLPWVSLLWNPSCPPKLHSYWSLSRTCRDRWPGVLCMHRLTPPAVLHASCPLTFVQNIKARYNKRLPVTSSSQECSLFVSGKNNVSSGFCRHRHRMNLSVLHKCICTWISLNSWLSKCIGNPAIQQSLMHSHTSMHNTWVFVSTKLYIKASELYHNNAIIFGLAFFSLATLL